MLFPDKALRLAASAVLAALICAGGLSVSLFSQQTAQPQAQPRVYAEYPLPEPSMYALPLPEDRGAAALEQSLKRLSTTASVLMIVAHPDDEDGALLTYLSRGLGVRCTLLTLTRGEGGQNAMGGDSYDALGVMRTNELLKAGQYYGVKQLWGTEADFGFSKTQEEAFARWGHDRVLYDAVLAVRRERPQVIVSTFVGGITDGHGHHQVSGEIAQEAFQAAADPTVFPEQLKDGLQPWRPLAVYSMVPFAPVTEKGMFDYATGKWAPAKFQNYVTGEWTTGVPSTDVTLPVGTFDPVLGRSYLQIAREGWGEQKSQNGGANPTLSGPANTYYHLWAVAPEAKAASGSNAKDDDLFQNSRVSVDTSIAGLAHGGSSVPDGLSRKLHEIDAAVQQAESKCPCHAGLPVAQEIASIYRQTLELRKQITASDLNPRTKADLEFELDNKIGQFQAALKELLGLDLMAFTTKATKLPEGGGARGSSADETPRSITPGEKLNVRIHTASASPEAHLVKTWLTTPKPGETGEQREPRSETAAADLPADAILPFTLPDDAPPTEPYFTRPNTEQPYYDLSNPEYRLRPFAPWPLAAWAEFTFDGLPIRIGQAVQTMQHVVGPGGIYQPLVVTPAIGVRVDPEARVLPLDGSPLPVRVAIHAQRAADGTVDLKLPAGWTSQPAQAPFHLASGGDSEPIEFLVTPSSSESKAYKLEVLAHSDGRTYSSGWQSVGYPGLLPYNVYRPAQLLTRKVDTKVVPGLKVGYIMGTGDLAPQAIEALGVSVHILTLGELVSTDFSTWNTLVVGIRAYSVHPELAAAQPRLDEFVRQGGTLIVQYQSADFPAPFPLHLGRNPEKVVDESAPVKLLDPSNPLLATPNAIASNDFDGWVEERGHSFMDTWDPAYAALTETADVGQDPQRGGLLVAHPGKGTYIYAAYALYRQFPELVPGAYRILANLLSAGKSSAGGDEIKASHP